MCIRDSRSARLLSGSAVSTIPGRTGTIRYMKVPPVPPWRLKMLVEFEAKEQLAKGAPCSFDHRILELPYSPVQMVVLVGVVQEHASDDAIGLLRNIGVDDIDLDLSSTAVFNAYRYLHGTDGEKTTLFVDIGAEETHLVIERDGHLYFVRTLASGGRRFTQAVAQAAGVSPAEAEEMKRRDGDVLAAAEQSGEPGSAEQKMNLALVREASALAASLEASLMYARTQTGLKELAPQRLVLAGGGGELKGLLEFLKRRLKVEKAEFFDPAPKLAFKGEAPPPEDLRRMALVLGAAVSRIHPTAFALDLLPETTKNRREFFRRGIYLYYAAAVVAAALGMHLYSNITSWLRLKENFARHERLLQEDAVRNNEYEVLKEETQWLQLDLNAVLERVYSGRDILRVLSIFRKMTPAEIRLVELSVEPPKVLDRLKYPPGESFQQTRRLFVRGWAESTVSDRDAVGMVTRFAENLKKNASDLFPNIETVYISWDVNQEGKAFLKEFVLLLELGEVKG